MTRRASLAAGATLLATALNLPVPVTAQSCDRRCLGAALDRFLGAVLAHDPAAARLAPGFRYTENAIEVRPGEGLWRSATKIGAVDRRYVDTANGQAAFFGVIDEGPESAIATLRIKVAGGSVTEGELVIGRKATGVFDVNGLVTSPPSPLAARSQRTTRDDLVKAANSYFDGLETKNGAAIAAVPGCSRVENGVTMTGMGGRAGSPPVDRGDCANMSAMGQIAAVVHRRFPIVDEEAGVVVGMAVFNRPPGALRANGTLWPRNLLTEIFTIESGKITTIHAAMHYLEPDVPTAPGW